MRNVRLPFRLPRRRVPSEGPRPRRGLRGFRLWPLVLFGLFLLYQFTTKRETVPVSGRSQLVDINHKQELALGLNSYRSIIAQSEIIRGGPEVELIRNIGQRIAAVANKDTAVPFDWEFNLIRSEQANAFALPGGKVAVYTGILPVAKNENGIAAIMGHEIAHAVARHGAERMTHQRLAQFGSLAVGMSVGEMDPQTQRMVMGALGVGTQFGVLLPFSRKHESEADYIGLQYLARACFDPREAPRLWKRMQSAQKKGAPPEILSTHPAPQTRVEQFKEWLPAAIELYEKNCGRQIQ